MNSVMVAVHRHGSAPANFLTTLGTLSKMLNSFLPTTAKRTPHSSTFVETCSSRTKQSSTCEAMVHVLYWGSDVIKRVETLCSSLLAQGPA